MIRLADLSDADQQFLGGPAPAPSGP